MRYLLLLLAAFIQLPLSAQDRSVSGSPRPQNNSEPFGYKVLRGKIGKYPVTMHLTQIGSNYEGYYFYDSRHIAIPVRD